ncbi:hypothetical protein Shyd_94990 [Streptomyces hydrogenans]|uniref:Transposase n=1 Tax=Streptomyces hydrogenans TaxID=1873719 RepID=A0ABQ3PSZ5_9ACTN|nr:hypothetical protein GCM10018784_06930 [Streptomyces hydrogenans]GHI28128.1 hypothetical protein Shyd_94990 [Streptomyces hydrogenans]
MLTLTIDLDKSCVQFCQTFGKKRGSEVSAHLATRVSFGVSTGPAGGLSGRNGRRSAGAGGPTRVRRRTPDIRRQAADGRRQTADGSPRQPTQQIQQIQQAGDQSPASA